MEFEMSSIWESKDRFFDEEYMYMKEEFDECVMIQCLIIMIKYIKIKIS